MVYKILRKRDGLFKDHGFNNKFSKRGKMWRTLGHVRSHIEQNYRYDYSDCEVVEYELTPTKKRWRLSK